MCMGVRWMGHGVECLSDGGIFVQILDSFRGHHSALRHQNERKKKKTHKV